MPQAGQMTESAWYAFMGFDPAQHRRVRGHYVSFFKGCQQVLDIACGRGEFLDVLRAANVPGEGVDNDEGMVRAARAAGNQVELGDAFAFLEAQPSTFDGIFSAHFIEHLESDTAGPRLAPCCRAPHPGGAPGVATAHPAPPPTPPP